MTSLRCQSHIGYFLLELWWCFLPPYPFSVVLCMCWQRRLPAVGTQPGASCAPTPRGHQPSQVGCRCLWEAFPLLQAQSVCWWRVDCRSYCSLALQSLFCAQGVKNSPQNTSVTCGAHSLCFPLGQKCHGLLWNSPVVEKQSWHLYPVLKYVCVASFCSLFC